jgi:hypothetical protein
MTVDLQEAFINLAKSIESNPPPGYELNYKEKKVGKISMTLNLCPRRTVAEQSTLYPKI